jgi:hypothetical protein
MHIELHSPEKVVSLAPVKIRYARAVLANPAPTPH